MAKQKEVSSIYLTAQYLLKHAKSYICKMKLSTKANNVGQRVSELRNRYDWNIRTISEGSVNGVNIFHYKVIKKGKSPAKYK